MSNKKKVTIKRPKKSILRRWAMTNALFFFGAFTFFALIIYQITVTNFVTAQKNAIVKSMDDIATNLEHSDVPLTADNLRDYFDYNTDYLMTDQHGSYIQTSRLMTSMIDSSNHLFIFDKHRSIIFTSLTASFPLVEPTGGEVRTLSVNGQAGYVESRAIHSEENGDVIGYLQSFYDLNSYYAMRDKLLFSLLSVEIIGIFLSVIFGYMMAEHFITPLDRLRRAMAKVTQHPDDPFEPVIIKDDDEIRQLAAFYNEMMGKIDFYLENQRRFVSDVSHELRTPLAVLDGHVNLLRRWGKNDREVLEESLDASHGEIQNMKAMLEEMLALSRLEKAADVSPDELSCDVKSVALRVVKNFKLIHEDLDLTLDCQAASGLTARIDSKHYEQALTILIDNAIKYSPSDRTKIEVSLDTDDAGEVVTRVRDHGLGISDGDVGHVFERFFRADKARNREIGGTGLGLSIIHRLAENYGGEISVESQLDKGSTFTLKLPEA